MTDFRGSGWCRVSHKSLAIAMRHLSVTFHGEDSITHSSRRPRRESRERERSKAGEEHEGEPFAVQECALPWTQSLHPRLGATSRGFPLSSKVRPFPAPLYHTTHPPAHSRTIISCCHSRHLDKSILNPVSRPHSSPASSSSFLADCSPLTA